MIRRVIPAAFAVVLLVVGQLGALAHEAGTRHVTCGEHGEQLDAPVLTGAGHVASGDAAHWHGVESGAGAHSHCIIAQTLHQASTPGVAVDFAVAPVTTDLVVLAEPVSIDRELALYAFAPKTSPPSHLRTS